MERRDPPLSRMEHLNEAESLALLRTVDVGRLAVATDENGVDIFPVNHVVDHGTIVFRTGRGTKLDRLASSSRVAFEADELDPAARRAWSVVVRGDAHVVERHDDVVDLFGVEVVPWHASDKPIFVRLVPVDITGRRLTTT